MSLGLQFSYLWHDLDVIELRIVAENIGFRGCAELYIEHGQLLEVAEILKGFPQHSKDSREVVLGAFGPGFAGGAVRLAFHCKDMAGHPAFWATIEAAPLGSHKAECAEILVDFEPASLDRFLADLRTLDSELQGCASLAANI